MQDLWKRGNPALQSNNSWSLSKIFSNIQRQIKRGGDVLNLLSLKKIPHGKDDCRSCIRNFLLKMQFTKTKWVNEESWCKHLNQTIPYF
jgi:hypothetical protein